MTACLYEVLSSYNANFVATQPIFFVTYFFYFILFMESLLILFKMLRLLDLFLSTEMNLLRHMVDMTQSNFSWELPLSMDLSHNNFFHFGRKKKLTKTISVE